MLEIIPEQNSVQPYKSTGKEHSSNQPLGETKRRQVVAVQCFSPMWPRKAEGNHSCLIVYFLMLILWFIKYLLVLKAKSKKRENAMESKHKEEILQLREEHCWQLSSNDKAMLERFHVFKITLLKKLMYLKKSIIVQYLKCRKSFRYRATVINPPMHWSLLWNCFSTCIFCTIPHSESKCNCFKVKIGCRGNTSRTAKDKLRKQSSH